MSTLDTVLYWEIWAAWPWIRGSIIYCQSQISAWLLELRFRLERNWRLIPLFEITLFQFSVIGQRWKVYRFCNILWWSGVCLMLLKLNAIHYKETYSVFFLYIDYLYIYISIVLQQLRSECIYDYIQSLELFNQDIQT